MARWQRELRYDGLPGVQGLFCLYDRGRASGCVP